MFSKTQNSRPLIEHLDMNTANVPVLPINTTVPNKAN